MIAASYLKCTVWLELCKRILLSLISHSHHLTNLYTHHPLNCITEKDFPYFFHSSSFSHFTFSLHFLLCFFSTFSVYFLIHFLFPLSHYFLSLSLINSLSIFSLYFLTLLYLFPFSNSAFAFQFSYQFSLSTFPLYFLSILSLHFLAPVWSELRNFLSEVEWESRKIK